MLEIRDLSASYGKHRALEQVGLTVHKGEIVVILGANGAGKSTLLKAISGICEGKVAGHVRLGGEDLIGLSPDRIVEAGIALVPEGRGVFGELNVYENLLLGAYSERARDDHEANLDRVMTLFPRLDERRKQAVRTMSGGEQQMVAIGRAMMSAPQILMLDEPSLGLSPLLSKDLFASLRIVRDAGIGILLVEQNAKASLAISDRGYLLENGQIVHSATAATLANDPAVQAAYLGGKPKGAAIPAPTAPPSRAAKGPQPADIAAAALASVAAPPRPTPKPAPDPAPVAARAKPAPAAPRPPAPKPAPVRTTGTTTTHGISIDDLVARAADASRQSTRAPRTPATRHPSPPPAPASPTHRAPVPDINTDSRDRLAQILGEIEDAAKRAEAWRPTTRN